MTLKEMSQPSEEFNRAKDGIRPPKVCMVCSAPFEAMSFSHDNKDWAWVPTCQCQGIMMTDKQKDLVISIFRMGLACGLGHPYEFFCNYTRTLIHCLPYDKLKSAEDEAAEAFVAFMKGTAACPEEETELKTLTSDKLYENINAWYEYKRAERKEKPYGGTEERAMDRC